MKKKKLKTLSLKKASISKLNGGAAAPGTGPILLTRDIQDCLFTRDIFQCTWYSELYTACNCEPTWDGCGSQLIRCEISIDIPCEA